MLLVGLVAFFAAGLTLFSGFGLGTLLLPAFALLFPVPIAVAATAVVHLANNLWKLALLGKHAQAGVVFRFGLPAALASCAGALCLAALTNLSDIGGRSPVAVVIGGLIAFFALVELTGWADRWAFSRAWLPWGGLLTGFLGGLSGHQGALRSAFLIRLGLERNSCIATGVVCAVLVDVARILVYGTVGAQLSALRSADWRPIAAGIVAAFAGSFLGARLVQKVTLRGLQWIVGLCMLVLGLAMAIGWVQ